MMGGAIAHEYMASARPGRTRSSSAARAATRPTSSCAGAPALDRRSAAARAPAGRRDPDPGRAHDRAGRRLPRPAGARLHEVARRDRAQARRGPGVMALLRGDHELCEPKLRRSSASSAWRPAEEVLEAQGAEAGFVGPVPTPLPVIADEVLRRGVYVAGANKADHHLSGVSADRPRRGRAGRRPLRGTPRSPRRRPVPRVARAARERARDRGRQHLPARHQVLRADGRDVPRRAWGGAAHRHGQLRHRPRAHRRRGHRAAPRRARHHLAARHRALRRAPGPGARRRRDAARARRAPLRRAAGRRASRSSSTTATPRPASSSPTPTCWAVPPRSSSASAPPRASSSSSAAPRRAQRRGRGRTRPRLARAARRTPDSRLARVHSRCCSRAARPPQPHAVRCCLRWATNRRVDY